MSSTQAHSSSSNSSSSTKSFPFFPSLQTPTHQAWVMRNLKSHSHLLGFWSSLAVSDVVGHFDDLADPSSSQDGSFSAQYGSRRWTCLWAWPMAWWSRLGPWVGLDHGKGQDIIRLTNLMGMVLGEIQVTLYALPNSLGYYFSFFWLKANKDLTSLE